MRFSSDKGREEADDPLHFLVGRGVDADVGDVQVKEFDGILYVVSVYHGSQSVAKGFAHFSCEYKSKL